MEDIERTKKGLAKQKTQPIFQDYQPRATQARSIRKVVEILQEHGFEPGMAMLRVLAPDVVYRREKEQWEQEHPGEVCPLPEPGPCPLEPKEQVELLLKLNKYVEPELKAVEMKGELSGELTIKWAGENS